MAVPNIFGTATSAIPLSQLDTNFATPVTIGNTAVQLGNTVTSFGNVTLTNVTISSGNVTLTGANVSGTANVSTLVVTGNQTSLGNVVITGNVSANIATFSAGTASLPAITTTGDTNTGIFFPAADTIAFTEGGVESVRIDSSGNMGIGTASPSSFGKLAVVGDGYFSGALGIGATSLRNLETIKSDANTTYGAAAAQFPLNIRNTDTTANNWAMIGFNQGASNLSNPVSIGAQFTNTTTAAMVMVTSGSERMRITSAGNVGIGTSSPSTYSGSNLVSFYAGGNNFAGITSINSNSGTGIGGIQFGSDATYVKAAIGLLRSGANGQGSIVFYNDSNADAANWATTDEKMRIDTSGNVGIGQTSITRTFANYNQLNISGSSGASIQMQVGSTTNTNIISDGNALYLAQLNGTMQFATGGTGTGTERMRIDSSGNVLVTSAAGLGYGTGSGGTVTQGTSRTTGVTLSKPTGAITMFSAAGSVVAATFTVTNTLVAATDTIILNQKSGTNLYVLLVTAVAAGSFNITFYTTGGVATDAPVINFSLIKGVTA
jgi:hypothetical protein